MVKWLDILKTNNNTASNSNQPLNSNKPVNKTEWGHSALVQVSKDLKELGAGVAALELQDLQAFWLSIMANPKATNKEKLQASKLYADSIGAFDQGKASKSTAPVRYSWGAEAATDAEIVQTNSTKIEE